MLFAGMKFETRCEANQSWSRSVVNVTGTASKPSEMFMLMMFLVCAQEETRAEVVVLETPHNINVKCTAAAETFR